MTKFILTACIALSVVFGIGGTADAGLMTFHGTERGFWDSKAVVVGHVLGGTFDRADSQISVQVIAVVATDTLVMDRISVNYIAGAGSALSDLGAKVGDTLVMCIEFRDGGWVLDRHRMSFFRGERPAQKIDGIGDQGLADVIAAVRRARSVSFAKERK